MFFFLHLCWKLYPWPTNRKNQEEENKKKEPFCDIKILFGNACFCDTGNLSITQQSHFAFVFMIGQFERKAIVCFWSEGIVYVCSFMNLELNPAQSRINFQLVVLHPLELCLLWTQSRATYFVVFLCPF